jgi:DNA-binding transcriptional regulator WhiA
MLPTDYQKFIHFSKYSRWQDELGRRETWEETVERYINFLKKYILENQKIKTKDEKEFLKLLELTKTSILKLDVVPSMRSLKMAGPALEKHHASGYNCSFISIDHPHSFDEILYLSCCGCGVGFSVEKKYISKLPEIPLEFYPTSTVIDVPDSKIGWASALRELISLLYAGKIPKWDISKVRPYGAILKTFGGRASGPGPLVDLFEFVVKTFQKAAGRCLESIECHDICCKIGLIAESGGTRRAALISLSDVSDGEMCHAKSGNWWEINSQRSYANNSAVYYTKPELGIFLDEWISLFRSKSGERGILSLWNLSKTGNKRRDWTKVAGVNPSMPAGILVMTNEGIFPIQNLENKKFQVKTLNGELAPAKCVLSSPKAQIYKIDFGEGKYTRCTQKHKWPVLRNDKITNVETGDLEVGDLIPLNPLGNSNISGNLQWTKDEGFLLGMLLGDGWLHKRKNNKYSAGFVFNKKETELQIKTQKILNSMKVNPSHVKERKSCKELQFSSIQLCERFVNEFGFNKKEIGIPNSIWISNDNFIKGFIDGIYSSDGNIYKNSIALTTSRKNIAEDICKLLSFYGLKPRIKYRKMKNIKFPNNKIYDREYDNYNVVLDCIQAKRFAEIFTLSHIQKQKRLDKIKKFISKKKRIDHNYCKIKSIILDGEEKVWDISVDHKTHVYPSQYCFSGNCGEILLRPNSFCNLSEVVVRPGDTFETLKNKVQIATFIGTMQSCLTKFKYIRKIWQKNSEEERLLGVSLTGILDNKLLIDPLTSPEILQTLKTEAIELNKYWSDIFGINASVAITTVKPSGNTSQLVNSASGIHPRYSQYYIRTVRMDNKDPLTKFMMDQGIPNEPCILKPQNTTIFSFPIKSPKDAILRDTYNAIQQLELMKIFKQNWAEHNVSITVYVKDSEWLDVASWVYKNFDIIGGITFLPYDGGTYKQAPYREITEEEYDTFLKGMPTNIDWSKLTDYENEDRTVNSKELACMSGNSCEL